MVIHQRSLLLVRGVACKLQRGHVIARTEDGDIVETANQGLLQGKQTNTDAAIRSLFFGPHCSLTVMLCAKAWVWL